MANSTEKHRSFPPKMAYRSPLASMSHSDIQELIWENGQVSHRGLTGIPRKNHSCDEETLANSVSGDSLLGIHSLAKSDKLDTTNVYQNSFDTIFDSQVVPLANYRDFDENQQHIDSQVVPFANRKSEDYDRNNQVPQFPLPQFHNAVALGEQNTENVEKTGAEPGSVLFRPPGPLRAGPTRMKPTQLEVSVADEQSAAVGCKENPVYERRFSNKSRGSSKDKPLVEPSSIYSLEASNNPNYSLKRKYEDTEGSTYISENGLDELDDMTKSASPRGWKRNRNANVHNQCEKKRRDKISRKMRTLQDLVPNGERVDKAATLDVVIEYIKTLQLQLQMMMSMGSGVFMAQRMLPAAAQQMNAAPHMAAYQPDLGRMQMGLGCYHPFQLPNPSLPGPIMAPPPGMAEASLNLLGCPGQMMPMSTPHSHFPAMPSIQSIPPFGASRASGSMENQSSAPLEFQFSAPFSGVESGSRTSSGKNRRHDELAQTSTYQARKKRKF